MSLTESSERSPLLGHTNEIPYVPAHSETGLSGQGEEGEDLQTPLFRDEQPSNASLAVILGSVWVCFDECTHLSA